MTATRAFTDRLLSWLRGKGRILIVVHDNPDPDCFASALALYHLFIVKLNRESVIAFSGMIGRSENLAMARLLEIPLTPLEIIDPTEFNVICMLDTQPGTGNNSLPAGLTADLVIDHHPMRDASKECRWVDIRDNYGATASILYEYLEAQEVGLGTKLATALFYAIKSETQDLGRESEEHDRKAYLSLFPMTNKKLLYEITHPKLPAEYFVSLKTAIENARIYGPVLISRLESIVFPEIVAELADLLLNLEGVDTILCSGVYNEDLILSMRTARTDINSGEMMKRVVSSRGVAGGHGMMGGGRIDKVRMDDGTEDKVEELFLHELGVEMVGARQLSGRGVDNGKSGAV